jgi:hypothetical protein
MRMMIAFCITLSLMLTYAALAEPNLYIKGGNQHHLGRIPTGRSKEHIFYLENTGFLPITLVWPPSQGCACTTAEVRPHIVNPFGESVVVVKVDVEGYGRQMKDIEIECQQGLRRKRLTLFLEYDTTR